MDNNSVNNNTENNNANNPSGVEAQIQELRKEIKRANITSMMLGVVSIVLAICLAVSVIPRGTTNNQGNVGNIKTEPNDSDNTGDGNTDGQSQMAFIGIPSEAEFGDYKAASDYSEIYEYVRKRSSGGAVFTTGSAVMKEEAAMDMGATSSSAAAGGTNGSAGMISSTNVMTMGVDESDISKTDGDYIYNATGSEIVIFDIREREAEEYYRLTPEFDSPSDIIREIYIDGEIMSVVTEHAELDKSGNYGSVNILIYDIADRQKPVMKGKYSQSGNYQTSRKVGDMIYLFTNRFIGDPGDNSSDAITSEKISEWFPTINGKIIDPGCVYLPENGNFTLVMSAFNQNDADTTVDAKVIISDYSEIYVGSESIFLYNQTYAGNRNILKLSKLGYHSGVITTGKTTSVRGYLSDRFAINEYNGYLRIVTTEWNNTASNILYIFDKDMKECGRISNIANGESLYACRFMGDVGYFVTFEQTDPLFSVDLKDPYNPAIVGELKIPGFSEYLHFWGDNKLLGIGYDTDTKGSRRGLKLSMFDISDQSDVKEEAKLVLRDGDYAPGFYNYKAVLAFPEGNLFGFSYVDYDGNKGYYKMYSYDDGVFTQKVSESYKSNLTESLRGHFVGDFAYISCEDKVVSLPVER